jgi:adenine-specific DNA-methyltransferase
VIKYIGSKRLLVPLIVEVARELPGTRSALDLFSGTSRVGIALKAEGLRVIANDHNAYAATLARCYIAADRETWAEPAARLIAELDALPGRAGWFTETYCVESRFFQPENGARVDRIRDTIQGLSLPPPLEAIALTSLLEAADRVDSTTGVQMAYLKQWAPRAYKPLQLRLPELSPRAPHGPGEAWERDAVECAGEAEVDIAYVDPPYNQHKYLGNYHIWESLVRWDRPEVYGVARKRADCRLRQSAFNSRPGIRAAMAAIIGKLRARHILVSFNNEGYISRAEMEALLRVRGTVRVIERDFKRYVGAQIGIYSPQGQRVGEVGALTNKEYLFLVSPEGAGSADAAQPPTPGSTAATPAL